MNLASLREILRRHPLVASVQAPEGTPLDNSDVIARMARASHQEGCRVFRVQGVENVRAVRECRLGPILGLIKRDYPDSPIYITPTRLEVDAMLEAGADVVALDATPRTRPGGVKLAELVARIHAAGRLAMADCDGPEAVAHAQVAGADLVGTTLAGYTDGRSATKGPDLAFLREAVASVAAPVLAEGRFEEPWQLRAALQIGAAGVVIGGALNDPLKQTRRFLSAAGIGGSVGAVDLGGTWMRFARVGEGGGIEKLERAPLGPDPQVRLRWIRDQIVATGVARVGVSTGGTVDPRSGEVWEAKPILPGHVGSVFSKATLAVPVRALNDGLATAWGHACLPEYAGGRVATLALGTGLGCGLVADGRPVCGPRGEYPRLNDLPAAGGRSFEDLLGGAALSPNPSEEAQRRAVEALESACEMVRALWLPDAVFVGGGVGLSPWMRPHLTRLGLVASPLGENAGLIGAAALARWDPF